MLAIGKCAHCGKELCCKKCFVDYAKKHIVDENAYIKGYEQGINAAKDIIIQELKKCIEVTNTLPEQQRAYKYILNWIVEED